MWNEINTFIAEAQRAQRNAEEKQGKRKIKSLSHLCVPLRSLRLCCEVS
jgi:hypothetical protein